MQNEVKKKKKKTVGNQIIFHLFVKKKITDIMRQFIIHEPIRKSDFAFKTGREREKK